MSVNQKSTSLKRLQPDTPFEEHPPKKIHPFFAKSRSDNETGTFKWLGPLGKHKSCFHGINYEPKCSGKIAAFDLDGTIIKAQFGAKNASGDPQWEWWRSTIPDKLKMAVEAGYSIVIFSNQALKPSSLKQWKEKIASIALALNDIPFHLFAATKKDEYRKPMVGMWRELERTARDENVGIDLCNSFFVGDAAGRQYSGRKSDFSSTDRKFALNVGIPFMTPEEYFLGLPTHTSYTLPGFHVSSLPDLPLVTPTSLPIVPPSCKQEVVLFCGYPALGKTHFYQQYFQPRKYVHINQDSLKTRDKCIKATREALRTGKSCVIDNTNRDAKTRKYYVDIANELNISSRCFLFTGSIEFAWHNNLHRTFNPSPNSTARDLVPYTAFTSFREQYEEPKMEEGFSEIRKVNWKFVGSDEERKRWSMWLQIDGT